MSDGKETTRKTRPTNSVGKLLVREEATIKEAMRAIDRGGLRIAIIIDAEGRLRGTVTDGDIRRGILKGLLITEPVSRVMNDKPVFAEEEENEKTVAQLLKKKVLFGMPIVDSKGAVKDFLMLEQGEKVSRLGSVQEWPRRRLERVLVIGGGGYIGSVLVRLLLDKGYKVSVLEKFLYGKESLTAIADHPSLRIIEGDTRHVEDVTGAARDADAVVHLAELVGDPACAMDPSATQEFNYLATRMIGSVCKHFQINRLVYASSCSVYGASESDELLTEDSALNPVSLYAKMKIASEDALRELADENFAPTILRLGTVFGFSHRPRFDLVVNILTAKALRDGRITVFGGDQWRPNVHVADVAKTVMACLEAPLAKVGGQVFNVGTEENNLTINEIGRLVNEAVPSARLVIEEKDVDKRDYKVDFSKLRAALGVRMGMNVADGIAEVRGALEADPSLDYAGEVYSNIKFLEQNGWR